MSRHYYILTLRTQNQIGIIHQITTCILAVNGDILSFNEYVIPETNEFLCRVRFEVNQKLDAADNSKLIDELSTKFGPHIAVKPVSQKLRMGILVSGQNHCLQELLYQHAINRLPVRIPFVISNHDIHAPLCQFYKVPFYPITLSSSDKKEDQILEISRHTSDFMVLARYMQILSPQFIDAYQNDIINVHHSILPAFKGGNPYQQAYDYGVKLIGATSHFVTENLDEGPIIEQDVVSIHHRNTVTDITEKGHWIEKKVLSQTCRLYAENRVLRGKQKVVVFS